ncbi:MAG: hypothetical protein AABW48_00980 [Nanoarchaeota archaeon]
MANSQSAENRTVEPIVLENIVLYGMDGKPAVIYKRLELDGEVVHRRDGGEYLVKSQNKCETYFYTCNDGRRLPTLPEIYAIIERLHETRNPALKGIVNDLNTRELCTGTEIEYSKNRILHRGVVSVKCSIPTGGRNYWLDEAVKKKVRHPHKATKIQKDAVQALLMCKDVKNAVTVLHEASGKRPSLGTPWTESRRDIPSSEVWLYAGADSFIFDCNCCDDLNGTYIHFRGVRANFIPQLKH